MTEPPRPTPQRVNPTVRGRTVPIPGRAVLVIGVVALTGIVAGFQLGRATAPPPIAPPSYEAQVSLPAPSPLPTPTPSLVVAASVAPALSEAYLASSGPGWAICQVIEGIRCQRLLAHEVPIGDTFALAPATWQGLRPAVITGGHLVAVAGECGLPLPTTFRLLVLRPNEGARDLPITASAVSDGCVTYLDLSRLSPGRYAVVGGGVGDQGPIAQAVGFSVVVPIH